MQREQDTLQELLFLSPCSVPANGRNQVTSSHTGNVQAWLLSPHSLGSESFSYAPIVMGGLYVIQGGFCHSRPQPTATRCHQH